MKTTIQWEKAEASRSSSRGFTLIELLVVVAVIGLLIGLLLPAVQMARESARRSQCTNNLRQLGIALDSYVSAVGVYPNSYNGTLYSAHSMLLPYLDQKPIYDSINFDVRENGAGGANETAYRTSIFLFICPDDPPENLLFGWTNYAVNIGTGKVVLAPGATYGPGAVYDSIEDGLFANSHSVGPRDIADGASSTIALAERVLGPTTPDPDNRDPLRSIFRTSKTYDSPSDYEAFANDCRTLNPNTAGLLRYLSKGSNWLAGDDPFTTNYNHVERINGHSCIGRGNPTDQTPYAASTAGSLHGGGGNALFADGHVQFLKESMNLQTWRALSTRSCGEVVSSSAF